MNVRPAGWWVVGVMLLASSSALAQSAPARPKGTVVPTSAPPIASDGRGPAIVPAKPRIAPRLGPAGDAGATPSAARADADDARRLSISARQSAEKTIAALVAAMKSLPRKPDPPPTESRLTSRRPARAPSADGPAPIDYRVVWPASAAEPAPIAGRVELSWPDGGTAGPIALRWDASAAR
jgi:hypothetical protein